MVLDMSNEIKSKKQCSGCSAWESIRKIGAVIAVIVLCAKREDHKHICPHVYFFHELRMAPLTKTKTRSHNQQAHEMSYKGRVFSLQ